MIYRGLMRRTSSANLCVRTLTGRMRVFDGAEGERVRGYDLPSAVGHLVAAPAPRWALSTINHKLSVLLPTWSDVTDEFLQVSVPPGDVT